MKPNPTPWKPSAFYLRLFAASLLVPVFEELLMRGYVFRFAYQWAIERREKAENALEKILSERSINDFVPGAWNLSAVVISSLVFAMGHNIEEWPAAILYGLLMSLLWILRKDLISCVVAHGTTSFALGIYVCVTQRWEFW